MSREAMYEAAAKAYWDATDEQPYLEGIKAAVDAAIEEMELHEPMRIPGGGDGWIHIPEPGIYAVVRVDDEDD